MASRRRNTTAYNTYGSVAYAPAYDGSAVRVPRREEDVRYRPQPKRRERVRQEELTRTQVQVREAGQVAPFAVVGFIAVAIFAALVLFSHAQSTVLNAEIVELRGQLTTLEAENAKLSAQYEQVFDMAAIQSAVGEGMTRPSGSQVVYLDLSEPDTVVVFDKLKDSRVMDTMKNVGRALGDMIEYFR